MASRRTIGVVSDTHGWLDPFLLEAFAGAELIVHAGDIGDIAVIDALAEVAPVLAVRGNIDGGDLRFLPLVDTREVGGRRVSALHIAGHPGRPKPAARRAIAQERSDVLVVGHSHIYAVGRVDGALWINPGAAGRQGFHRERTAVRLHLEPDGSWGMDRIELGPRGRSAGS